MTDSEEVQTFNLFGSDLYENLNKKEFYDEDEDISNSELKFLKIIRDIRDNNKDLYQKISQMPKKSRSGKKFNKKDHSLISFFRKGKLKKFLISDELIFIYPSFGVASLIPF